MLRPRERAIFALHEGFHLFDQKFGVAVGAPAAELGHMRGRVFADARFGVVDADDQQRLDHTGLNVLLSGLTDMPVLPWDKGGGAVEKVLAVVKIEDGKMTAGLLLIARRRVHDEVALIAEKARAKFLVFAKLSGTHGAR